ncbi:MAG: DUF1648 domain-containing protein [Gemmatimonadetes bacterium]|nr:MAG: DUF1648 domain-containing protein [Gemmatimonadota bacterium]
MKMTLLIYLILILAAVQCLYYAPQLPDVVASHFDAQNQPDGWCSKSEFINLYLILMGGLAILFVMMGGLMRHLPNTVINLPNKDYWLAPERSETTMNVIQREMHLMAVFTLLFLMIVVELIFRANLNPPPVLPGVAFWSILGIFMAFTVGWGIRFVVIFSSVPEGSNPSSTS